MTQVQSAWLKKYLVSAILTAAVSVMALDGGVLFFGYVIVMTPVTITSFFLSKNESLTKRSVIAVIVPLISLGLAALVIEMLPLAR